MIKQKAKGEEQRAKGKERHREPSYLRYSMLYALCSALLCLLLAFIVPGAVAGTSPLRVFDAEGEEFASLQVLESQEAKYVRLEELTRLFSGTRKYEPLIGRMTVIIRGKRVVFTLGRHQLKVDDEEYVLSSPPVFISGEVAIPLEFLTEMLPIVVGKKITLDREDWVLQISHEPFVERDLLEVDSHVLPSSDLAGFRVIIDPGHGGYDTGARTEAGLLEKDLSLEIAQQIRKLLAMEEGVAVHLTRSGDNYMTAAQRVNFANKLRGHVYLSIHFNWSPSQRSGGFRIYVNSNRMRLGTGSDLRADMFSRARPADELSGGKRSLTQSKWLAREIVERLKDMELTGEEEKEAFLAAMGNLSMPGVLVEVLYLSNPQDLITLSGPDFINSVSRSLCDSVLAFKSVLESRSVFGAMR